MTKKLNNIQSEILKKFMYNKDLKYNEIWNKNSCSSSNFDYHLKVLINLNLLKKEREHYILTSNGIAYISSIDGVSIQNKKKPVICAFILAVNENKEILISIRAKQPYFEHLNIPGGKQEYGEFSSTTAIREFEEETGLKCDVELKMITEKMTINRDDDNHVEHQISGYFYLGTNVTGELIENTREGKNIWINVNDMKNYLRFPDLDYIVPHMISGKGIKIAQITRYRENNKFVDMKINDIN